MRSGVIVLGLATTFGALAGCGFSSRGAGAGASSDAEAPGPDACATFATQVDTCQLTFDGDLMLSGTVAYDTTMHELRVNGTVMSVAHTTLTARAGDVDAIFAHNVRLTTGTTLRATGTLPFAIVAGGSVTLDDGATIDVGKGGAGALPVCSTPPKAGGNNTGGAGGGGGGGYAADGGDGSDGNLDGSRSQGGMRGRSIAMPAGPLGGCPGAPGGTGDSPGGLGGLGGGALYIAAADRIELLGNGATLTAGGGGGHGGGIAGGGDAGGGGGGTGGMIFLEAGHVLGQHGRIAANGGGGGEGSNDQAAGHDGDNGSTTTSRAAGGAGNVVDGTDGGLGGSLGSTAGETVTMRLTGGGGGGGGGVGYIHVVSSDFNVETVSPAAN
jgi:hypothetical protein